MNTKKSFLPSLLLISLLLGCTTVSDEPAFDTTPAIRLVEIAEDTIVQFQDQVVLTIGYEDGDGDLGTSDPDVNSIFVQDARLEEADEYYLPPLAPEDSKISIQGTFQLELSSTFLLGNGDSETTFFYIHLFDRADNQSNTIEAGPITILKE